MTRRSHALQSEYEIVRQSEAFQRAPVQSRLLDYLYEMAAEARTTPLTQRDVALDGLGREESFDETTDSYVRVQVSRLRKTLRRYYATHDPVGQGCIYIAPGSYELKIGSLEVGYPKIARHLRTSSVHVPTQKAPEQKYDASANLSDTESKKTKISRVSPIFRSRGFFAGSACGVALLLVLAPTTNTQQLDKAPHFDSPPTVKVSPLSPVDQGVTTGNVSGLLLAKQQAEISVASSIVSRPQRGESSADFNLKLREAVNSSGRSVIFIRLDDNNGNTIHRRSLIMPADQSAAKERLQWEFSSIVAPSGSIARNLALRINDKPQTGFECFIATERARSAGSRVGNPIENCSNLEKTDHYYPFLAARELFGEFQEDQARYGKIRTNTKQWVRFSDLVTEHRGNPYVASLAVKVLSSEADCDNIHRFQSASELPLAGYPALQAGMLVEALGCARSAKEKDRIASRLVAMHSANSHPSALLQLFLTAGFISIDRKDLVMEMATYPLRGGGDNRVIKVTEALQNAIMNKTTFEQKEELRALIWSAPVRRSIYRILES